MKQHILEFTDESQITDLNLQFNELIVNRIYPLTRGIPFCKGKIEHCVELFTGTGKGNKPDACKGCALVKYCDYNGKGFTVHPIVDCDDDLLKFLEERDENIDDWF